MAEDRKAPSRKRFVYNRAKKWPREVVLRDLKDRLDRQLLYMEVMDAPPVYYEVMTDQDGVICDELAWQAQIKDQHPYPEES